MRRRFFRLIWPTGRFRWFYRLFLGFIVFNIVAIEVTSQSWFCNSCHIMNTYYASWKSGTHSKVDCVKCHIPPGTMNYLSAKLNGAGQVVDDLLSRTSGKPSASVSDFSCTREGCHDLEKVRQQKRKSGKYFFDHGKHLDLNYSNIEVHCTTCHSHVKGEKHFEVHTNTCITCHLAYPKPSQPTPTDVAAAMGAGTLIPVSLETPAKPAEHEALPTGAKLPSNKCSNCHSAPDKPFMYQGLKVFHAEYLAYGAACESCHRGVTAPTPKVKEDQCYACHDFGMEKLGSVAETHKIHTSGKHKVECFGCHGMIRHGPSAQSMRLDQIDCQNCHMGQHAIQQATYKSTASIGHENGTTHAVSPMFMAHVNCSGCHQEPKSLKIKPESGAKVTVATAKACDTCHKPGLGEQMIPMWQKNTRTLYQSVTALLPATPPQDPEMNKQVTEAQHMLDLVRLDGSWGVHNPRYTQELLNQARAKLMAARPTPTPETKP